MKTLLSLLLTVLISTSLAFSQRALTTDDVLKMTGLSSGLLSPEGDALIFGKRTLSWKDNKYETRYYYSSTDGKDQYQYIGEDGASSLAYSPDGKFLSFMRSVDKKRQIFVMRTSGGEAIQLTKHKNSISSYQWSSDASFIVFVSDIPLPKDEEKRRKDGYDEIFVDEGPNGQSRDSWNQLWKFDLETESYELLTKTEQLIRGFDISPDGSKLVYAARFENRRNEGYKSELFLLEIGADTTGTQITDNNVAEGGITWHPDGVHVMIDAPDDKEWELRNDKLWLINTKTRDWRNISGKFEGNIRGTFFSEDGSTIYFNGQQGVNTNIYSLDVASGDFRNLTERDGTLSARDMSKDRSKVLFSFSDFDTPDDLFFAEVTDLSNAVKLTDLNPAFADSFKLAKIQLIQWRSKNKLDIEGLMFLPPDFEETPSPFLLHIHGGPAGVFANRFSGRYHVWANLGYVQLAPNVRGSSGYTDELLRGNMKDIGGGDYHDLMTGVDHVIKLGYADKNKLAVRGWSYGGILGGTVIRKTDRFKAASLGAGVYDWTSEYGVGFNYDIKLWYIGGSFWENPKAYRDKSVLTHVEKIKTPLLLLHGLNDRTDTEAQSMMLFAALKDLNRTVRYIQFPREPHGFREPRHQRTRDIEEIKWIQKYTLGLDWEAGEFEKTSSTEAEK